MKKKCKIKYLPVAQRDLIAIIEYKKIDRPGSAIKFLDRLDKPVVKLEEFPFMGQSPGDNRLRSLNYRILVVDSYFVFYVVKGGILEIRRIIHGKKNILFCFSQVPQTYSIVFRNSVILPFSPPSIILSIETTNLE